MAKYVAFDFGSKGEAGSFLYSVVIFVEAIYHKDAQT
jgi:hypothetical protein